MLYEITSSNSIVLYHHFQQFGYIKDKQSFNKELFTNNLTYQRTYVYESEGQIVSFIQYGKSKNNEGIIRFFATKEGFDYAGKELLFRAASYFYIFHLNVNVSYFNTSIDALLANCNLSTSEKILNEFNFTKVDNIPSNFKTINY